MASIVVVNDVQTVSLHAPKALGLCQDILYGTIRTEMVTHHTFLLMLLLSQEGYTMRRYLKHLFHQYLLQK